MRAPVAAAAVLALAGCAAGPFNPINPGYPDVPAAFAAECLVAPGNLEVVSFDDAANRVILAQVTPVDIGVAEAPRLAAHFDRCMVEAARPAHAVSVFTSRDAGGELLVSDFDPKDEGSALAEDWLLEVDVARQVLVRFPAEQYDVESYIGAPITHFPAPAACADGVVGLVCGAT